MTWLIIGLGNPGPEYEHTRHNAGFLAADALGESLRATYWKDEAGAKVSVVRFGDEEVVLAKPQTFMNVSGKSVAKLAKAYGVPPANVVVIHDDLDLPAGDVRVKKGGGHGGHNGLRSVHADLGTPEYLRVRMGIGRPPGRMDPADYVLEPIRGAALEDLEAMVPTAASATVHIMERGAASAMSEYNGG